MSTLWAMALGPLIDKLGVRKSGVVGFTIYAIARFTICFIDDKDIFKFTVQWISPIAEGFAGLSSSLYGLGIKRYTTQANRNFAYAMYYAIYNMGGALAGFAIDAVSGYTWSPWGDPISGLRMALLMGLGTNT
jgi:MFS family permease|eukprot:COSAG06_NODE_60_length_27159_cov_57.986031_13_plen_133_part_00